MSKALDKLQTVFSKLFEAEKKMKDEDPCWDTHKMIGMKKGKKGKPVPNCVPKNEEVELSEGRPSQRHPLEGHEYHKKTDAQLEYIAKDARKAAEAMKSHDTDAENKYRDQANDSATVRYWRKKNGMPDWYKKKYGHMKESVELDEAFSDAQIARLKSEYSKISGIDPDSASYKQLIALLDKQDKATLQKLADSGIKFISGLARNRVIRMKEEVEISEAKVGDTVSFHHELKSAPGSKVKKSGTVERVEGDVVHVKVKDKYGVKRHQVNRSDLVKEDVEDVAEMDNRTHAGDRREKRAYSPEALKQREKELQADLKKVSPEMRKKLRLPEPKEGVAEESDLDEDQIDEISQDALRNYFKKSVADLSKRQIKMNTGSADSNDAKKMQDRKKGLSRASSKIAAKMEEVDLNQLFTEAMKVKKKSEETSSKKSIKKGEPLSGKQEPVKLHPEVQTKN